MQLTENDREEDGTIVKESFVVFRSQFPVVQRSSAGERAESHTQFRKEFSEKLLQYFLGYDLQR